jgi:ketosteroid isomerase-like protein
MSQSNIEIVRAAYEALRDGGVDAILGFFDERFEATAPPELSVEPQTYRGREGVARWFALFYEVVDEVRLEPEEFLETGDQVIVPLSIIVKGHDSGIEVGQRLTQVWRMRDGLAISMQAYPDKATALAALGLIRG